MDTKSLNVVATELTLLQIQLNAVLLLLQAQDPTAPIREQFRRLVDEGVEVAGLEMMQRMEDRLRGGIVFQELKEMRLDDLWRSDEKPDSSTRQTKIRDRVERPSRPRWEAGVDGCAIDRR